MNINFSAIFSISSVICDENIIPALYSSAYSLSNAKISFLTNGSNPDVGSSKTNNSGLCESARHNENFTFIPFESSITL